MMLKPAHHHIDLSKNAVSPMRPSIYRSCLRLISRIELVFAAVALSEGGDVDAAKTLIESLDR